MSTTYGNITSRKIVAIPMLLFFLLQFVLPAESLADLDLIAETPVIFYGEMHYDAERDLIYFPNGYGLLIMDISNPWRPEVIGQCPTGDWSDELTFNGNTLYILPSSYEDLNPKVDIIDIEDPSAPELLGNWIPPADDRLWAAACNQDLVYVVHGTEMPGGEELVNLATLQPMQNGSLELISTIEVPPSSRMIPVGDYLYLSAAFSLNLISLEDPELPECIDVIGGMWWKMVYQFDHVFVGGPFNAVTINNVEDPEDPFIVNSFSADTSVYDISVNREMLALSRKTGLRLYGLWDFPDEELIIDADAMDDPTPWQSDAVQLTDNLLITSNEEYGLRFFDIIDPFEPELFEEIRQSPGALADKVCNLGDDFVTMSDATDLITCMRLIDNQIEVISEFSVPDIQFMEIRGNLGFVSCGSFGIRIIDFENREEPEIIGTWNPWEEEQLYSIWALTVTEDANTVYISCTPDDDDMIIAYVDVSDPENPEFGGGFFDERAFYDLVTEGDHLVAISNNYICTFNIEDQHNPEHLRMCHYSCGKEPVIQGDYIYLTSRSTRTLLRVIDVSNMNNPVMVYSPEYNSGIKATSLLVRDDVLMMFCGTGGIVEFDVSNPEQPDSVGLHNTPGNAKAGCWSGNNLVLSDYSSIRIYDYERLLPLEEFTVQIEPGWSIISSPVTPDDPRIIRLLDPLNNNDNLQIAKDYMGHFFIPHLFNNIPPWDIRQGYWIKLNEADSLVFTDEEVPERLPIPLPRGWSAVGYFPRQSYEAPYAFRNVNNQLIMVKDDDGDFYLPEHDFCNMAPLRRGRGYQVKVSDSTELVWNIEEMVASITPSSRVPHTHFIEPQKTGINMSLLIVQDGEFVRDLTGSETGVFTGNGLCVGVTSLNGEGPWGVCIWGDDQSTEEIDGAVEDELLAFRIWDGSTESNLELSWLEGAGKYYTDDLAIAAMECKPNQPDQLALASPYPNPFNGLVTLDYSLNQQALVQLMIFDIDGRLVKTLVSTEQQTGNYSVIWDASDQPTGVYLVNLETSGTRKTTKVIHLK